ncbi:MAG: putative Ig domain-containing protein [Sulfurovum sp.]|nr:putative Ig domain-containing protein [Sulfurovum sp.]
MKNVFKIFSFMLLFLSPFIHAIELVREDFTENIDGWTVSDEDKVKWSSEYSGSMFIDKGDDSSKNYIFEPSTTYTVEVRWCPIGAWNIDDDYLDVQINNETIEEDYSDGECQNTTFTAQSDNSGNFEIKFTIEAGDDAYIEWFTIDGEALVAIGCDSSLDINNDISPGQLIPPLNLITANATACISGASISDDKDYYNFTVSVDGIINIVTSSPNNHTFYLEVVSSINGTLYGPTAGENRTLSYSLVAGERIILITKETGLDTDYWQLDLEFIKRFVPQGPPNILPIPDQSTQAAEAYILELFPFIEISNEDPILSYILTGSLPTGLSFDTSTGILSGTPTVNTTTSFNLSLSATDNDGTSSVESFILSIIVPPINATDNSYSMTPGSDLTGNIITDDTGNGSDTGTAITLTSYTNPSEGILTINSSGGFTYTPISSPANSITFTYTITDSFGGTNTATVTIQLATNYQYALQKFLLINPPDTRNIIGGYQIAGNTVLCLTEQYSQYGGTCQGQTNYQLETSNRHVSKFIDIDGDSRTWNSSSSYVELPDNYEQRGGDGLLWAGLFWQGRIAKDNGNNEDKELRYGIENGTSYDWVDTGRGSNYNTVSIVEAEANRIKLKIDTEEYNDVTASTVYIHSISDGETYAAFADVTGILQDANLPKGKHTFTVANLTTNEGRENTPGIFGGWSLVVIYLEDPLNGSPRNISIYSGFDSVHTNNDPITISGFRLPSAGTTLTAKLSLFSGEGEYRYGRTEISNSKDTIEISNRVSSNYQTMPGSSNPLNVFDAVLDGILRDEVVGHSNNLQVNNNGVDVDNFDVSSIMSAYRDADPLIQSIYIRYFSDTDYITPSMIAFSTELYQPKICYDYTLDVGGYVVPSSGNEVNISFAGQANDPLTTRVAIQSQEGDFPLQDVNLTYRIADTSQLQYVSGSTALAPNGISGYIPAGPTGLNQTYDEINSGFGMYIGTGANEVPGPGGQIGSFQTRYLKFDSEFIAASVNTPF